MLPAGAIPWTRRGIHVNQTIEIKTGINATKVVTVASISADGLTLFLREANTLTAGTGDFEIVTAAALVGGLVVGREYEVDIAGGFVRLLDPTTDTIVAFTTTGVGVQGFAYRLASKSFAAKTAVNNDLDTITITNHGLQTGDLVVYGSDPSRSTTVQLWGFLGADPTTAFEMGAPVQLPDAPINGLRSANAYFVVRVDANTIRLVNTKLGAFDAQPVDITRSRHRHADVRGARQRHRHHGVGDAEGVERSRARAWS